MPPKFKNLTVALASKKSKATAPPSKVPKLVISDLGRQVTTIDTSQEHDTCLALAHGVMLPQNMPDLVMEDAMEVGKAIVSRKWKIEIPSMKPAMVVVGLLNVAAVAAIKGLLRGSAEAVVSRPPKINGKLERLKKNSAELKKAKKKANSLEVELMNANKNLASAKTALTDERRSHVEAMALSLIEMTVAWDKIGKALAKKDNALSTFHEVWLVCLQEHGTSPDHPAWAVAKPTTVLLEPPEPYSPILSSGFNKEEYVNQPVEKEVENGGVGVGDAALAEELQGRKRAWWSRGKSS
ncbi:hypothetical protein Acr_22g0007670 [Actinidia rufa]|uniref:Uncharacterized protein n=1 Tax=Actinidia rufa TaxID=165716 RepID=A0A7J0GKM3_9ERIC|nr:hypothetical protein Acr_22g0007670 [Actinidia rufa]